MRDWREYEIQCIEKGNFPKQLKAIKRCPTRLFYRGKWDNKIFEKSLAVVGSRKMSHYGQEVVAKFVPELASRGITIISGFMYGIDSEAHWSCLNNGGITVAVLGGGLNVVTPKENDRLYSEILDKGGLVISEFEVDFEATRWSFPQRNRIVSGLSSLGILVVEAEEKSGTMITARIGREQGKNIFAIPGQINSNTSEGTNHLIKEGLGRIVTETTDIYAEKDRKITQRMLLSNC
ncbi:DNA-processing protein DprA [Patescibacteria group bacterium]|nr:DNA-processing protein DprA [Patescibacteria group bacterium]